MVSVNLEELTVVLFDEDWKSAEISKTLFQQANIRHVRHLRNVELAFEKCSSRNIDVLIVDMDFESDKGGLLISRLREAAVSKKINTRILVLIGSNDQERILNAASFGIDAILIKPISPLDLKKRLIKLLNMAVNYQKFEDYYGPDRRIMPDRLPEGEEDKRKSETEISL